MKHSQTTRAGLAAALTAFAAAASVCQDVGYFAEPSATSAATFAALALVGATGLRPVPAPRQLWAKAGVPVLGLALLGLGLPWLAAIGIIGWGLLAWAPARLQQLARLRSALGVTGALLMLGHLALPFWVRAELAAPSLEPLAALGAGLLGLFGLEATAEGAVIHLAGRNGGEALLLDPFKLGGLFAALGTAFTVLLAWQGRARRALLTSAGIVALVGLLGLARLLVVASLPSLLSVHAMLLDPLNVYLAFVPVALLVGLFVARRSASAPAEAVEQPEARTLRPVGVAAAAVVGLPCLAGALVHHEVGELRAGGVVMDESHGNWEASDVPFDKEDWGRGSTYNYAEFSSLLGRHFEFDVNRDGAITSELLRDKQVVILKTPSSPYSADELDALHAFVEGGGGIWLIGDHTNLYGMSDSLNAIAGWAGMQFRKDAVYDAATGGTTFNSTTVRLHPASIGSDDLAYQTSCSLAITGPGVEPVLVGWRGTGEYADYGHPNFFGDLSTDLVDRTGLMLQAAIGRVGRGKVAAFTDSTIFSNFSLFDPGVSELVLRTVQNLRHEDTLPLGWRGFLLALGVALAGLAAVQAAPRLKGALPAGAATFGAAFLCGSSWLDANESDLFAPPAPTDPYRKIAFVEGASSFVRTSFIDEANSGGEDEHAGHDHGHGHTVEPLMQASLSTFMNWALRVDDARPMLAQTVEEAVAAGAEMIVVFDPVEAPTHDEATLLEHFVGHGGVLLVLDDIVNARGSAANAWLSRFELEVELVREEREQFQTRPTVQLGLTRTVSALAAPELVLGAMAMHEPQPAEVAGVSKTITKLLAKGGSALFVDESGDAISTMTQLGRGRAGVFTMSSALTNDSLGGRFDLSPTAEDLRLHLTAVELLEAYLDFATLHEGPSE